MKNNLVILFCLFFLTGCGTSFQNFNKQKFTKLSELKNSNQVSAQHYEFNETYFETEFLKITSNTGPVNSNLDGTSEPDKSMQILSSEILQKQKVRHYSHRKNKFPLEKIEEVNQIQTLQRDPIITDRNSYNWFFFIGLSIFVLTILNYILAILKKTRGKTFFIWAASIGLLTTWIMSWGLIKGSTNVAEEDRDNGYKAMLILAKIVAVAGIVVLVFLLTLLTVLIVISLK